MRMSFRQFTAAALAATFFSSMIGCGGGGSDDDSGPPANSGTPREGVVVLPADGSVTISNLTEEGLTLTGAVPNLRRGSIIVSARGEGLLRKVKTVATNGASTNLTTDPASLDDLFVDADLQFEEKLDLDDFEIETFNGVTVGERSRGRALEKVFTFNNMTFSVGGDKAKGSATLNGDITLSADFDFEYNKIGDVLIDTTMKTTCAALSDLTLKGAFKGEIGPFEEEIAVLTGKVRLIMIGKIPVVYRPVLTLKSESKGAAEVGIEAKSTLGMVATSGLRSRLANNHIPEQITGISRTGDFDLVKSVYGSVALEVNPVVVELQLEFYGLAGPFVASKVVGFTGELKKDVDPSGEILSRKLTFTASFNHGYTAGVKGEILGEELFNVETTLADTSTPIKSIDILPGNSDVIVE